jgi:hypothetical protein
MMRKDEIRKKRHDKARQGKAKKVKRREANASNIEYGPKEEMLCLQKYIRINRIRIEYEHSDGHFVPSSPKKNFEESPKNFSDDILF